MKRSDINKSEGESRDLVLLVGQAKRNRRILGSILK